jgi:hypothetical protein
LRRYRWKFSLIQIIGRLGRSDVSRKGEESGDGCQCDDVMDFVLGDVLIHKVFWFLLSSSSHPTIP